MECSATGRVMAVSGSPRLGPVGAWRRGACSPSAARHVSHCSSKRLLHVLRLMRTNIELEAALKGRRLRRTVEWHATAFTAQTALSASLTREGLTSAFPPALPSEPSRLPER